MSTNTLEKIDARLEQLDPNSLRFHVMVALRRFRASWIELGRLLSEIVYGGDYKEWGYDDFDAYCSAELGLKKPTVKKLLVSYGYMRRREPDRLAAAEEYDGRGAPPDVPDYQTVELLHKAEQGGKLDEEEQSDFHRMVFENTGEADETAIRKQIRGALRGETAEEAPFADQKEHDLAAVKRASATLRKALDKAGDVVPDGLRRRCESALLELEALE